MRTTLARLAPLFLALAAASFSASAQTYDSARVCQPQQLKPSISAGPEGGLGHMAYAYQVTNTSNRTCRLYGVPVLRILDRRARIVDIPVCAGCGDYLFNAKAAEPVSLKPGGTAHFLLGAFHGDETVEMCRTFDNVEVRLPGGGKQLRFSFAGANVPTCNLNESAWREGFYNEDKELPGVSLQTPLPFLHEHDVILFQGDSITDGGRQRTGSDYNHIMGQDYAYILAAEVGAESAERELVFVNRGISGNRIPDLEARWQDDAIALHPQLLSILIGVNDLLAAGDRAVPLEQFEARYDKLLAETIAALPTTRIVLGEPFLLPVAKQKADYAANMVEMKKRQAAVDRLGAKYHLPVVHYQQAFDGALAKAPAEHWSWDGVHPTYAGHGLMAEEWLKTVDSFWSR